MHAAFAAQEIGCEAVMINSNPETVSTDYDTSDHLFFEPLTHEDVMNVVDVVQPEGIIVQFGGQTPLNLANGLDRAGAPLIGTSVDSIDRAEDRERFQQMLAKLDLRQPPNGIAKSVGEAFEIARNIGYPVLVRPSYVLGGRAMEIVFDDEALDRYMTNAVDASPDKPILVDKFLEDAIEVDVDCIADAERAVIGGIMEHIEEAGIHSGDSSCVLPSFSLSESILEEISRATKAMARELGVIGLMNVQYAVKDGDVYVIEVNPRASRTVPFVSKAIGVPLAKRPSLAGMTLSSSASPRRSRRRPSASRRRCSFNKFPGVDMLLSPEMRSTGEVMGIDPDLGYAFAKAYEGAGMRSLRGRVLLTVKESDKARSSPGLGRSRSSGTSSWRPEARGKHCVRRPPRGADQQTPRGPAPYRRRDQERRDRQVFNTPSGRATRHDGTPYIRSTSIGAGIPCVTTLAGIRAVVSGSRRSARARSPCAPPGDPGPRRRSVRSTRTLGAPERLSGPRRRPLDPGRTARGPLASRGPSSREIHRRGEI